MWRYGDDLIALEGFAGQYVIVDFTLELVFLRIGFHGGVPWPYDVATPAAAAPDEESGTRHGTMPGATRGPLQEGVGYGEHGLDGLLLDLLPPALKDPTRPTCDDSPQPHGSMQISE